MPSPFLAFISPSFHSMMAFPRSTISETKLSVEYISIDSLRFKSFAENLSHITNSLIVFLPLVITYPILPQGILGTSQIVTSNALSICNSLGLPSAPSLP